MVGVGVDNSTLMSLAQDLGVDSGPGEQSSAKYYGGEVRKDAASSFAHVAVAAEAAGYYLFFIYLVVLLLLCTDYNFKRHIITVY